MRHLYALIVCLVLVPAAARAQTADSPVFIIDFVSPHLSVGKGPPRSTVVRLSTLNDALANIVTTTDPAALQRRSSPVESLLDLCQPPLKPREAIPALIQGLFDCFDCVAAYQETRYTVTRGDTVLLLVLYKSPITVDDLKPFFSEVPRSSELVATAKALRGLLKVAESGGDLSCHAFTYRLQRKRSYLKVILPVPATERATGDGLETTTSAAPADATSVTSPEATVGPEERWFMSADFSISKASASIGEEPTPGAEELKSKDFFVALNFALGDLLVDRKSPLQRRNLLKELVFKVQATPSRSPWEAWAVGVGIRGLRMQTILWNFDMVHPYVTIGRQTLDDDEHKWRVVFGLGFDPRTIGKQE
jgi:hypothetical protein